MFYDAIRNDHGLAHDPFKALVVPRPIGWISSLATDGTRNLAPYSFFNAVGDRPHYVMFASAGRKDSQRNCEETGEFVCSLATWALREAMNVSSASVPPEVDEFELAGLTPAPSRLVRPPRVAESPVALECVYERTVELPAEGSAMPYAMVIGKVVGIHIDDGLLEAGRVVIERARPIARLGYHDYTVVDEVFSMVRPGS
ncbi:MAG: flavin reductase family protein [Rhizobiales bacterium]|nr:flavin reductase family protein [Hyphomicrobiales bacterium]